MCKRSSAKVKLAIKTSLSSLLIFLLCVPLNAQQTNRKPAQKSPAKSTAKAQAEVQKAAPAHNAKSKQNMTNTLIQVEQWQKEDFDKYKSQLAATDIILKHEKNPSKKMELFLRRAFVHLMMAQILGMSRSGKQVSAEESKHLNLAEKILNFYEPYAKNKPPLLASIQYMRGLIAYEYGKFPQMIAYFKSALETDPADRRAPSLALIIAEYFYENDKYQEAIDYYAIHYARMSGYQRDLADYKTAWCYIGMVDYDRATQKFVTIVARKEKNKFRADALKDLAFILAENKLESEIILLGQTVISDAETRSELFMLALESYYAQSKMDNVTQLFVEALKIQKKPVDRLKTRFFKMEFVRKEYLMLSQWEAAMQFKKEYDQAPPEDIEKFKFSHAVRLEDNFEHSIRIFADTYNGKIASPERLEKSKVLAVLLNTIETHIELFPKSKKLGLMWSLWIDLCHENAQFACLNNLVGRLEKLAATTEAFRGYFEKALLSRLSLWDQAYTREPDKNYAGLVQDGELFLSKFPQSKEVMPIRKRLALVLMKHASYDKAIEHFEIIVNAEPQSPLHQELAFCYFQIKKYDKVILLRRILLSLKNPAAAETLREAYLKKAIQEKEGGNLESYRAYTQDYLSLQKDVSKRALVYLDIFSVVAKEANLDAVKNLWQSVPAKEQVNPALDSLRAAVLEHMFDNGDIRVIEKIDRPFRQPYSQILYRASNGIELGKEDWRELAKLKTEQREYFLGLYLLDKPEDIKNHVIRSRSTFEKQIAATAQKLVEGKMMTKIEKSKKTSKLLPLIRAIQWPALNMSVNRYSTRAERIVLDVRDIRRKVPKEMKNLELLDKIVLATLAAEAEKKCGDMLLYSPVPTGLSEAQTAEYKKGLADLAQEFVNQSTVFAELAAELQKKQTEIQAEIEKQRIPDFDSANWRWPSDEVSVKSRQLAQKRSLFAALFFLDRKLNQKKINPIDYHWTRTGLIAEKFNHEAGKEFLRQELIAAQQEAILNQWKGVTP